MQSVPSAQSAPPEQIQTAPSQRPDRAPWPDPAQEQARPHGASGAALAREAALASRRTTPATQRGRGAGHAEPGAPEDPTGGATPDDEDAQVSTRRPQELVEQLLGGQVLEVIDETR